MSDQHTSDPPTTPSKTWTSLSTYSRFDSEDASSDYYSRRTFASPARTDYNESSFADEAEVEAALSVEEGSSSNWSSHVLDPYNFPPRILSMITERTEPQSRPSSFRSSTFIPPRPASAAASNVVSKFETLPPRSVTPGNISRTTYERSGSASPERPSRPPPRSNRALDLIAFFEDKSGSDLSSSQTRTFRSPTMASSSPTFPSSSRRTQSESSSSYNTVPRSTTVPTVDSRPFSPIKSVATLSSFLSPARTETHSTYSTAVSSSKQLPRTPVPTRSPLTSVRKIVAAWKERTPSLGKSSKASSIVSDSSDEGFFSIKRREVPVDRSLPPVPIEEFSKSSNGNDNSGINVAQSGKGNGSNGNNSNNGNGGTSRKSISSGSSSNKSPFDLAELGPFVQPDREPLRVGRLWYLNVHAPPPFRWIRTQAVLYPHMLVLSWIAPGGGRGVITLDLLNCNEVRSVPSPNHPSAQDDIGTIAAREQATGSGPERTLREFLCPFQLLYPDGVERLGAESARERVRWVGAVWEALNRAVSIPDPSVRSRSPAPSIGTIKSESTSTSSSDNQSKSGSRSTVFVPPLESLPDIGGSSNASVSSRSSLVGVITTSLDDAGLYRRRASDDASIDGAGMLYPTEGSKVIAPSRSSSLRRTSSLEDLNTEFKSAFSEPQSIIFGKPVTVSSGPSTPGNVFVSPPPSAGKKGRGLGTKTSSESSESATFRTAPSRLSARTTPASSYYSFPPSQRAPSHGETPIITPLRSLQTISSESPHIRTSTLSLRGSQSASMLGDSHDGDLSDSNSLSSYPSSTPSGKRVTFPSTTSPKSPKTPSKTAATSLSRSPGIRRRTPRRSSVRKTSSSGSNVSYVTPVEGSDKENEGTVDQSLSTIRPETPTPTSDIHHTPTRNSYMATPTNLSDRPTFTRTSSIGYDLCPSSDLSDFTPLSMTMTDTYSYSFGRSQPELEERSDSDIFLSVSERAYSDRTTSDSNVYLTASEPTTYATARTPSPTSTHFSTASRAPTSTQYDSATSNGSMDFKTASTFASTEYESLESIPSSNEYQTAELCSEYETAEKCPSSPSTEFVTVEPCPCPPSPRSVSTPEVPESPESVSEPEPELELEPEIEPEPEVLPSPEVPPKSPSLVRSLSLSSESSAVPEPTPVMDSPASMSTPTPEPEILADITPISTATEEESSSPITPTPSPQSTPTPTTTPLPSISPTLSSVTLSVEAPTPSSPSSVIPSTASMITPSISTDSVTPTPSSPSSVIPSTASMITPSISTDSVTPTPSSPSSIIPSMPSMITPSISTDLVAPTPSSPSLIIPSMPSMTTPSVSTDLATPSTVSSPEEPSGGETIPSITPSSIQEETMSIISSSRPPSRMSTIPSLPDESSPRLTPSLSLGPSTRLSMATETGSVPYTVSLSLSSESSIRASTSSVVSTVSPSLLTISSRTPSTPSLSEESDPTTATSTFLLPSSISPTVRSASLPQPSSVAVSSSATPSLPSVSTPRSAVQASLYEESVGTYESSLLEPSPSVHSLPLQDGLDISYDTSFLGPTMSSQSEPQATPPALSPPQITVQPSSPPAFSERTVSSPTTQSSGEIPVYVEDIPPPRARSRSPSSLTPSSPMLIFPPLPSSPSVPSSSLSPPSEPTPSSPYSPHMDYPSSPTSTLMRTPSSVSSVSMRSSRISPDEESLYEYEISVTPTEFSPWPSLSSESSVTPQSSVTRSITETEETRSTSSSSTPIPPSSSSSATPTPTATSRSLTITPQASFRVSVSTLWSNVPSIRSQLDTIPSDVSVSEPEEPPEPIDPGRPPSSIITHDVNRLLEYLNDINVIRNGQHLDLRHHIDNIEKELKNLANKVQEESNARREPVIPRISLKDVSIGRSSVSSRSATPVPRRSPAPPSVSSMQNVRTSVLSSLTTSSSSVSWLSSHHSDDWELMSSEDLDALPMLAQPPSDPSSPSTTVSSLSSSLPSDESPESTRSSSLTPQPTPYVEPLHEQEDIPPVEPQPDVLPLFLAIQTELAGLRSHFDGTRQLIDDIHQARDLQPVQIVIPPRTEIIREERAVPDEAQQRLYSDTLREVQAALQEIRNMLAAEGRTTSVSGSTVTDDIDIQNLFAPPSAPEPPTATIPIHTPTPVPAQSRSALLDRFAELSRLPDMPEISIPLEPLPSIRIPAHRPRPRSTSPSTVFRPSSAPVTGTGGRPIGVPAFVPSESSGDEPPPDVTAPQPGQQSLRDLGHPDRPFAQAGRTTPRFTRTPAPRGSQAPPQARGTTGTTGPPPFSVPPRPPTAPPAANVFVQRRGSQPTRQTDPQPPPSQRQYVGGPPQTIPVPAVPSTELQDILQLLRNDRDARNLTLEQQDQMISYMRNLNAWLERDVRDRHAEIQGVGARIDQLRNDLSNYFAIAPASTVPAGPVPYPGAVFPPRVFQGGPPIVQQQSIPPGSRAPPFRGPGRGVRHPVPDYDDDDEGAFIPPPPEAFADIPGGIPGVPPGFMPYTGAPPPPPGFWPAGPSAYSAHAPPGFISQGRGPPRRPRIDIVSPSPTGRPRQSRFRSGVDDDDDDDEPFVPPRSAEVSPARTDITVRPPGPRPPPAPNAPPAVVFNQPSDQELSDVPRTPVTGGAPAAESAVPSQPVREAGFAQPTLQTQGVAQPAQTQQPLIIIPPPEQQRDPSVVRDQQPSTIIIQQPSHSSRDGRHSRSRSRASRPRDSIIIRPPPTDDSEDEDVREPSRGRSRTRPTSILIGGSSRPSQSRIRADDVGRIPPTVTRDDPVSSRRGSPERDSRDGRTPSYHTPSRRPSGSRYADSRRDSPERDLHDGRTPSHHTPSRRPSGSRYADSRRGSPLRQQDYSPEDEGGRPSRTSYHPSRQPSVISLGDRGHPSRRSSRHSRTPAIINVEGPGSDRDYGSGSSDRDGRPVVIVPPSRHSSRRPSASSRRSYRDDGVTVIRQPSPSRGEFYDTGDNGGRSRSRTPIIVSSRSGSRQSRRSQPAVIIPRRPESYSEDDQPPVILQRGSSPRRESQGPIYIPEPPRSSHSRPPSVIVQQDPRREYSRSRPPSVIVQQDPRRDYSRSRPPSVIVQRDQYPDDGDDYDQPQVVYAPSRASRSRSRPPTIYSSRPPSQRSQRSQVIIPERDDGYESPDRVYVPSQGRRSSRPPSIYAPQTPSRPHSVIVTQAPDDSEPSQIIYENQPRTRSRSPTIISRRSGSVRAPSERSYRAPSQYVPGPSPRPHTDFVSPDDEYDRPPISPADLADRSRGHSPSRQPIYADQPRIRSRSPTGISRRSGSIRAPSERSYRAPSQYVPGPSRSQADFVVPGDEYDRPPTDFADRSARGRSPSRQPIYADEDRSPSRVFSTRPPSIASRVSYRPDERVPTRVPSRASRVGGTYADAPVPSRSRTRTPRVVDYGDAADGPSPIRPLPAEEDPRLTPTRHGSREYDPGYHTPRQRSVLDDPLYSPPEDIRDFADAQDRVSRPASSRRGSYIGEAPPQPPVSRPSSIRSAPSEAGYVGDGRAPRFSRAPTVIPDDDGDGIRPSSPEFAPSQTGTMPGITPRDSIEEMRGIPTSRPPSGGRPQSRVFVPPEATYEDQPGARVSPQASAYSDHPGAHVMPVSPHELADVDQPGQPSVRGSPHTHVLVASPPIEMQNIGDASAPGPEPLSTPFMDDRLSLPPVDRPESTPAISPEERMAIVFNNSEDDRRLRYQDAERQRDDAAVQAEQRRDEEFYAHEADRQRVFEEGEARRNQGAEQIREEIFQGAEEGRAATAADAESLREADAERAGSERAQSIRETVRSVIESQAEAAREAAEQGAQNERQELYRIIEAERGRVADYEAKVKALEEEIVTLRDTHEAQKLESERERTAKLEEFQAELAQRDTDMREQLANITRMLEEKNAECDRLRQLDDERWAAKEERRTQKDAQCGSLKDMLQQLINEQLAAKELALQEKEERAQQRGIDDVLEALRKHQEEQNAVFKDMVDGMKADCEGHHKDTLDTIKSTAQEQIPFNVQGYLDQFSQALAGEVRMLLGEVGKLREEKRNIQHEIGFLLCTKSKYGPGGEFYEEGRPPFPGVPGGPGGFPPGGGFPGGGFPGGFGPGPGPGPGGFPGGFGHLGDSEGPPHSDGDDGPPRHAAPAWRNVQQPGPPKLSKRQRRQKAAEEAAQAQAQAQAAAGPSIIDTRNSWVTWHPDPRFAPTPSSHAADLAPPPEPSPPGLFGPRSLSPKGKRM
ncbi:hypothetical protein Clacol_010420 [Clathrus columnatus]|uniref:PH domain-containing protein n=1 Tax=Clathrus columnatus TaxID=1419009 RepID=A0AAV5ANT0_9AGAM|nr:hypothetical protein Clacol_010420 [Clathrus columnatus]